MTAVNVSMFPALAVALFGGLILLVAMLVAPRASLLVMGTMLFFSCIAIIVDYHKQVYPQWLLPLQAYRSQLFGAFGLVLFLGFLPRFRSLSLGNISGHAWVLMLMGLYGGALRIYHVSGGDGLTSIALVFVTILPLGLILPALLNDNEDGQRLLRMIVWTTVVWVLAVAVQFVLNRKLLVLGIGNRFTGLISNCNQAATMLSVVAVCSLWLSLNGRRAARGLYAILTGGFLLLLIWTGSRGGMGMFVIGMAAVFYGRAGRAILLLPVFAMIMLVVLKFAAAANIELGAARLMDTTDTRSAGWSTLIRDSFVNPLIGVGPTELEASENSYLVGLAAFGVGMLFLILTLVVVGGVQCLRLWRIRRHVDRDTATLIDLVLGQQAMYFAGSVFEGYINARVASHLVTILVFAAIGSHILRQHRLAPEMRAEAGPAEENWDQETEAAVPEAIPEGA